MNIPRYSAVEQFGVPVDGPLQIRTSEQLISLLESYGVVGQEVPVDIIDITPYYWEQPKSRNFMTRTEVGGPVTISVIPTGDEQCKQTILAPVGQHSLMEFQTQIKELRVPSDQDLICLGGASPRYAGMLCMHELIARV